MFLVARTESNEPNKRVIMCQILKTESLYIHLNLCLYIINFLHSTTFDLFNGQYMTNSTLVSSVKIEYG